MVSRSEFTNLTNRVSIIESYLALSILTPVPLPITFIIEAEKCLKVEVSNSIYEQVKASDNNIFVRVYFHGAKSIKPQTELKSGHGFYEIWYLRPYYTVLIIKNIPSYFTHFDPKMKQLIYIRMLILIKQLIFNDGSC